MMKTEKSTFTNLYMYIIHNDDTRAIFRRYSLVSRNYHKVCKHTLSCVVSNGANCLGLPKVHSAIISTQVYQL